MQGVSPTELNAIFSAAQVDDEAKKALDVLLSKISKRPNEQNDVLPSAPVAARYRTIYLAPTLLTSRGYPISLGNADYDQSFYPRETPRDASNRSPGSGYNRSHGIDNGYNTYQDHMDKGNQFDNHINQPPLYQPHGNNDDGGFHPDGGFNDGGFNDGGFKNNGGFNACNDGGFNPDGGFKPDSGISGIRPPVLPPKVANEVLIVPPTVEPPPPVNTDPNVSDYPFDLTVENSFGITRPSVKWRGTFSRNGKKNIHMGMAAMHGEAGSFISTQSTSFNIKHKIKFQDVPTQNLEGVFYMFLDVSPNASNDLYQSGCEMFEDYVNYFTKKERAGIIRFEPDPVKGQGMLYLVPHTVPLYSEIIQSYRLNLPPESSNLFLGLFHFIVVP